MSNNLYAIVADSWAEIPKYIGGDFEDPGGDWSNYTMPDSTVDGRWYKDFWLVPGADFEFKFFINIQGDTQWEPNFSTTTGNRAIVVPDTTATIVVFDYNWADTPSAPVNLSYYAGDSKIYLSWDPPSDNSKYDVIYGGYYEIYFDTGPTFDTWVFYDTAVGTAETFTVTGLTNGITYFFCVKAVDAYSDTTGPLKSDYSESIAGVPKPFVNIQFRVFVGEINDSQVYIGYHDTEDIWREEPLQQEGATDWWSGTIPFPAAFNLKFKFIIEDTGGVKTYEYANSSGRYYHFIYPHADTITLVEVQGSWNGWGAKTTMELRFDSYWHGDVFINNGLYEYKFILNGSEYVFDPLNDLRRNNNSLLSVDCLPTNSTMREMVVPDTDTIYSYDWEDTPAMVPNFKAYSYTETAAYLKWSSLLAEDVETFYIEYTQIPSDPTSWSVIAQLSGDADSFVHWGCILWDTYYYRIKVVDYGGNESEYKNVNYTVIRPQIPTIILVQNPLAVLPRRMLYGLISNSQ